MQSLKEQIEGLNPDANALGQKEEDPSWVEDAEQRLEEKLTTQNYGEPLDEGNPIYELQVEIESLKEELRKARAWRPRTQHEIEELNLCHKRRSNKLREDTNKLLGLLVETLEENLDPNSFTRMKSHAVKNIIEVYDW